MNKGGTVEVEGIALTMTHALHSSSIDASGFSFDGGSPAGFVINIGGYSVYHSGDTGVFGDMQLIGELYKPEIALLPIGSRFTMGIKEAVKALKLIEPRIVVRCTYNSFDVIRKPLKSSENPWKPRIDTKVNY